VKDKLTKKYCNLSLFVYTINRGYGTYQNRINRGYRPYQNSGNRGYETYQNRINKWTSLN